VFGFLLDRLQSFGRPLLVAGFALALVLLCAAAGAFADARPATRRRPLVVMAALSLITLPLAALATASGPAIALVTLTQWLVFAALLELALVARATATDAVRRRLVYGAGVFGGAYLLTYLGSRFVSASQAGPVRWLSGARATLADTYDAGTGLTHTANFYVVSKNNIDDPVIAAADWRLEVQGLRPYALTYEELGAVAAGARPRTLACISNPVGGEYISTGVFGGVPLADLLMRGGMDAATTEVRFTCADGYTESIPLATALDPTTIVAVTLDGKPLAREHGFPARIVLSGRYGMKQPKWLTAIRPVSAPYDGYWEVRGWNKDAFVRTFSRLDRPSEGQTVTAGVLVDVSGVAFAGLRGIKGVQVSFDGGASWQDTRLVRTLPNDAWAPFRFAWTPPAAGTYDLRVRGLDGEGNVQDPAENDSFPDGSSGIHRISVVVR
jgi:DMSO/TMAO reductase YedYZ molybdopterin-dependent catalytic subunit